MFCRALRLGCGAGLLAVLLLATGAGAPALRRALAQPESPTWTPPANLSVSGAASDPAISADPDGTLYALWWDSIDGARYASLAVTDTVWSPPRALPFVFGMRDETPSPAGGPPRVTLNRPRAMQVYPGASAGLTVLWQNSSGAVLGASLAGGRWSGPFQVADLVTAFDAVVSPARTIHVAYVAPTERAGFPAGVYHIARTSRGWGRPRLAYPSLYFRSPAEGGLSLSIAARDDRDILIAWDDPFTGRSMFTRSTDGGETWADAQPVAGSLTDPAAQPLATFDPQGEAIFLWRDPTVSACRIYQRRSSEGGAVWGPPEIVLSDAGLCPARWSFARAADDRLWMIGAAAPVATGSAGPNLPLDTANRILLAAWDGSRWSAVLLGSPLVTDAAGGVVRELSCLAAAVGGERVGIVGCDSRRDVWAAISAIPLEQLVIAARTQWSKPALLSVDSVAVGADSVPAVAADENGDVYAVWTRAEGEGSAGACLYTMKWSAGLVSGPALAVCSPAGEDAPGRSIPRRSDRPALAVDGQGRLHVVWTSSARGDMLHSWALARESTAAAAWAAPAVVPAPAIGEEAGAAQRAPASWPHITAHPLTGELYVVFAVTFNEGRGVYLSRSSDGGATWSAPAVVFNAAAVGWSGVDQARMALDPYAGLLHVVWLRVPLPGAHDAQGVYYARSADMGLTWSSPLELSQDAATWLHVAAYDAGRVYVAWMLPDSQLSSDTLPLARVWGRYAASPDAPWSPVEQAAGLEVDGPFGLATDRAGHVYLAGATRRANGEAVVSMAWWDGARWSARDDLPLGALGLYRSAVAVAVAPKTSRLTALVNRWSPGADQAGAYEVIALTRPVDVGQPAAFPTPAPAPTAQATRIPTPMPSPMPAATPTVPAERASDRAITFQGEDVLALSGAAAALAVLAGVLGWRRARRAR